MSALLESLLDATRRADCAANDLELEQIKEEISTLIPAASDDGQVGSGVIHPEKRVCTEASTASKLPSPRRGLHTLNRGPQRT